MPAHGDDDDDNGISRRAMLQLLAGGAVLAAMPAAADITAPASPGAFDYLRSDAQFGNALALRVAYTWTTAEQIAELRAGGPLFSRSESPQYGPSLFDRAMIAQAAAGERWAKLLRQPEYRRARFAWTNPWATLLGWPAESYGDQLIRIELREDAWLAVHAAQAGGCHFVDVYGRRVKAEQVMATPRRLAGVYFIQDRVWARATMGTFVGAGEAMYRELVLCNEAMIASFEVGTAAPKEALRRAIAGLGALRRELGKPAAKASVQVWSGTVARRWMTSTPPSAALDAYEAALAFPNQFYQPSDAQLGQLVAALERALGAQPPSLHRP